MDDVVGFVLPVTMPPVDQGMPESLRRVASSWDVREQKDGPDAIRRAAREFEAYFIGYLMQEMRKTVPNGFIDNKAGEQFYSFYDQEIGRLAAEAGGFGLREQLESEIARAAASVEAAQVLEGTSR